MAFVSLANQMPPPGPPQSIAAAKVGGGAVASGLQLVTNPYVRVVSVATAADSITLPITYGGDAIVVFNDGAASMNVFGYGGATINGAASIAHGAGLGAVYFSSMEGTWHRLLQG